MRATKSRTSRTKKRPKINKTKIRTKLIIIAKRKLIKKPNQLHKITRNLITKISKMKKMQKTYFHRPKNKINYRKNIPD